ncbi:DUF4367 domain-containing protein [Priestia megaterium]|uniref:DUF4367 domain-containing protein n=1 Tax=Priestia megaterium TaxID=1404 RepID=UPI003B9E93E0
MEKKIYICLFLVLVGLDFTYSEKALATLDKPEPYEESYPKIGYQSVDNALLAFERHFKKDVMLPLRVPSIPFTHCFGRFSDLQGTINDSFDLECVHDQIPENHYTIEVRPSKHKIQFTNKHIKKSYLLQDGQSAHYIENSGSEMLVFEKANWQYMLSIDKRVSKQVSIESLIKIANSIDYSTKKKKLL